MQGYVKYLSLCKGQEINSWHDLETVMESKVRIERGENPHIVHCHFKNFQDIDLLQQIYVSFNDIDLIVGALSEIPVSKATVGPTMQCLLGELSMLKLTQKICCPNHIIFTEDQLTNAKLHDPMFYKNIIEETGVQETISHFTSMKLLCSTTLISNVQENVFLVPSER